MDADLTHRHLVDVRLRVRVENHVASDALAEAAEPEPLAQL